MKQPPFLQFIGATLHQNLSTTSTSVLLPVILSDIHSCLQEVVRASYRLPIATSALAVLICQSLRDTTHDDWTTRCEEDLGSKPAARLGERLTVPPTPSYEQADKMTERNIDAFAVRLGDPNLGTDRKTTSS